MLISLLLVRVLAHILRVRILCFRGPRALTLHTVNVVLDGPPAAILRRWYTCSLLLLAQQVVDVAAESVLLKLSVHILRPEPVLLTTRGQTFTTINCHNVPSDLPRTKIVKTEVKDLCGFSLTAPRSGI